MKIIQKKGRSKTEFDFGDQALSYTRSDWSGSRSSEVPYESINLKDRQVLVSRRTGEFHQIVSISLITGALLYTVGAVYHNMMLIKLSMPILALAFVVKVAGAFMKTTYTIFSAGQQKLMVIQDDHYDPIVAELTRYWKDRMKFFYAKIDPAGDPQQQAQKFRKLKELGVLTEGECEVFLAQLDKNPPY